MLACNLKAILESHTSFNGTTGGPAAISAAFVPGCMRRREFASTIACSIFDSCVEWLPGAGDFGPSCISVGGGGDGSLGDEGGKDMIALAQSYNSRL